jgi:hypothetical protein
VGQIEDAMRSADRIAFLGFAYHRMNMGLLTPKERPEGNIVLGTTYNMTEDNIKLVKGYISKRMTAKLTRNVLLKELSCNAFMEHFDGRLSFV